jgi:hypothetical protein
MKLKRDLTAPCGLDCFNCDIHANNITPGTQSRLSTMFNIDESRVPCNGCRQQMGSRLNLSECATYNCIQQKGIDFCYECSQFPCIRMQPIANGLRWYPHNLKLYNLCRIQRIGLDNWIKEEAMVNRFRYLNGKLWAGMGGIQIGVEP